MKYGKYSPILLIAQVTCINPRNEKSKSTCHVPTKRCIQSEESPNRKKISKTLPQKIPTPVISHNNLQTPKLCALVWKWPTKGQEFPSLLCLLPVSFPRPYILSDTGTCTSVRQRAVASIGTSPAFSISTTVLLRIQGSNDHHECQTAGASPEAWGGW